MTALDFSMCVLLVLKSILNAFRRYSPIRIGSDSDLVCHRCLPQRCQIRVNLRAKIFTILKQA
jgi:hypothetical protein